MARKAKKKVPGDMFIEAFRGGKYVGRLSHINGSVTMYGECNRGIVIYESRPLQEMITILANEGCVIKVTKYGKERKAA